MPSDYYWTQLKTRALAILLGASILTGAAGWQGGKHAQQLEDQTEITKYEDVNKGLVKHQKDIEGPLDEFLQDLRGHLAADAEIEHLFKASDLHSSKDLGAANSSGELASVECCKQEAKRIAQYFLTGRTNSDPGVRAIGTWLNARCSAHFGWRQ